MKHFTLTILLMVSVGLNAQYSATAYQDEYHELDNFTSLLVDEVGAATWATRFDFDFSFPFFDLTFDFIECDNFSVCDFGFDDAEGLFSLYLLAYPYEWDQITEDPVNGIPSDVRYDSGERDGLRYLVLQYTKMRLITDPSVDQYDSHVNFQKWFWEDGTIEIRVGPSNLDNSPNYVPGEGFYHFFNNETLVIGPDLNLHHPNDDSKAFYYGDSASHEEYSFSTDVTNSRIDWWPPEGWVIKISNLISSNEYVYNSSEVSIYPVPCTTKITIETPEKVNQIRIYDISGQLVYESDPGTNLYDLDISNLPNGTYACIMVTKDNVFSRKIVKI